uniref:ATP synthase complex subunit 8 n=1 Tax=Aulacophora indica TaxID=217245 RepID=A0A411D9S9_9CUCU|nr:ATP synthase F0 subunit 8 [Aulacophora indica]QAY81967.1 ATP synthase F0 subunit 8 [Aulacophora indica]QJA26351.1 ATP synthase F0 subunit 8 [Aulacophora indica]QRI59116.1 ATP synthase F0 subunit 8 [Aulacophora indica]
MPQMMPLNWLTLMLMFILIFYLFNNLIYFNFTNKPKLMKIKKNILKYSWKW